MFEAVHRSKQPSKNNTRRSKPHSLDFLNTLPNAKAEPEAFIRRLTGHYMLMLGMLASLMSLMAIIYLEFLQDPGLRFETDSPYELTSGLVIGLGAFIAYFIWRFYFVSREIYLRSLVLGFIGFTLIYLLFTTILPQTPTDFFVADMRSHFWWLAQTIFTMGFLLLVFGIFQVFRATRSMSTVYNRAAMIDQLHKQQAQTREEVIAHLEAANCSLRKQAATDWLTGVSNQRHFMWQAKREIARASREGTNLSLLCMDLDHFKMVNDVHGHQAGDKVLKYVASTIEKNIRPADLLARVGGEEFQVLLPDTDINQALEIAERGRSTLQELEVKVSDKVVKVTVSIGCAQLGQDGDTIDSLVQAGDQRLYEAKEQGRDRVVISSYLDLPNVRKCTES